MLQQLQVLEKSLTFWWVFAAVHWAAAIHLPLPFSLLETGQPSTAIWFIKNTGVRPGAAPQSWKRSPPADLLFQIIRLHCWSWGVEQTEDGRGSQRENSRLGQILFSETLHRVFLVLEQDTASWKASATQEEAGAKWDVNSLKCICQKSL